MSQNPPHHAADLILHPRWIVPVIPSGEVREHHSLVVTDGTIEAIVPTEEAQQWPASEHITLPFHAILPGLVNAHGHSAMSLLRGIADDYPLMEWLQDHIWPLETRFVSETFVADGTDLALLELVSSGTTCFSDMYFFPEITAQRADFAGLRAQLVFPVIDVPTGWASGSAECLEKGLQLRDAYRTHDRLTVGFGAHAVYTVNEATLQRIATLVNELQAPLQIHLHETQQEVAEAVSQRGERPLQTLNRLGLLGPLTQCVHMTALNDDDVALLTATNSHVIHCPRSNLKLASGICPVQQLRQADINVAIGTDGAASNNRLNMLSELQMAALLGKIAHQDPTAVPAADALEMATLGGARAMGLEDVIGSLELGKAADMIALDLSGASSQPVSNVISHIVYALSGDEVSHSWVAGKPLMTDGTPLNFNIDRIIARANQWPHRFAAATRHQTS